jgi:polar amino acid transport system substrate-binding protein
MNLRGAPLALSTGTAEPFNSPAGDGFLDRVIGEAFTRAGYAAVVVRASSSARSLANADRGIDDGLAIRTAGLEASHPNLLRVPEKLMDNEFVAYSSRGLTSPITGWSSLRPFDVAYVRGWKVFEDGLAGHPSRTAAVDGEQLFRLLRAGRVEIILFERWQGLWQARQLGMQVHLHAPPLVRSEMFVYLHRKHAALLPAVSKALAAMKADGTYRRHFDAVLTPLLCSPARRC